MTLEIGEIIEDEYGAVEIVDIIKDEKPDGTVVESIITERM